MSACGAASWMLPVGAAVPSAFWPRAESGEAGAELLGGIPCRGLRGTLARPHAVGTLSASMSRRDQSLRQILPRLIARSPVLEPIQV